jgi:hypothetical protein
MNLISSAISIICILAFVELIKRTNNKVNLLMSSSIDHNNIMVPSYHCLPLQVQASVWPQGHFKKIQLLSPYPHQFVQQVNSQGTNSSSCFCIASLHPSLLQQPNPTTYCFIGINAQYLLASEDSTGRSRLVLLLVKCRLE